MSIRTSTDMDVYVEVRTSNCGLGEDNYGNEGTGPGSGNENEIKR